ncbi:MAG: hypothetical protein Q9163_002594 [Psora crenata]
MAALVSPKYPPHLTPDQLDFLLSNIKDWSIFNGLAVRPTQAFVPQELDSSRSLATTAPVTLFPSLFPRSCFEEARAIQCAYNTLYAAIARDEDWLRKVVEELSDVDDFIASLWGVHLAAKREGYVQDLSLGIFRSDYMVHRDPNDPQAGSRIKQVEFNTIASSFGGLSAKVSALHRYLYDINAYVQLAPLIRPSTMPLNPSIEAISDGLYTAHKAYGNSKSGHLQLRCILFIVQDPENNVFDQYAISSRLQIHYQIPVFRLCFASIFDRTSVPSDSPLRPLLYRPAHAPSDTYEVTTLYFRAGYSPTEYSSPEAWKARLHLERSAAIKCPSILTHLAGSKKIQQILATPSSPYLERFLSGTSYADYVDRIRSTFAAIYPLDGTPAGQQAITIAKDRDKCRGYVMKPQREGGGNNIYGAKIPAFLASLGEDEKNYKGHILMELIEPPALQNAIFRNGEVQSGEVIGELGVYGVCLWTSRDTQGVTVPVLENKEAGFLLRTKGRESEEGGVAAGFGAVDSVISQPITTKLAPSPSAHRNAAQEGASSPRKRKEPHRSLRASTKERLSDTYRRRSSANERVRLSWSASGKLIQGSRSQPANLWNPVNSSIFTNQVTKVCQRGQEKGQDNNADLPVARRNHGNTVRDCNYKHQRQSNVRRALSPPNITPKATKQAGSYTPTLALAAVAPPHLTRMSPTPSLAATSDIPSKRPTTPAQDLESGGSPHRLQQRRSSCSASSKNSSLPGHSNDPSSLPWDPSHPCYPHPNPHIPLSSPVYHDTRIIRIPRDWMVAGDIAPTFSNTYPEILEPWVSEQDFRELIKEVNERLVATFSPFGWRAWVDLILGLLTGWIWEDAGFAGVKQGCKEVESFIESWNGRKMDKADEETELVRAIPLRRTGYLCLDIQIPDPHVGLVESRADSKAEAGEGVT